MTIIMTEKTRVLFIMAAPSSAAIEILIEVLVFFIAYLYEATISDALEAMGASTKAT